MANTTQNLILDPAGENVFITVEEQIILGNAFIHAGDRTFANFAHTGFGGLWDFNGRAWVDESNWQALLRLQQRLSLERNGVIEGPGTTILYNMSLPFRERAAANSRFIVSPLEQEDVGGGIFLWSYFTASEGSFFFNFSQRGCFHFLDFQWTEITPVPAA